MKHATSRMLFSYWDALRGTRPAPERGDIEPGQIRHVLANTFMLELGENHSADIRLAGTRLCALFGRELRGEPFTPLWVEQAQSEVQRCLEVIAEDSAGVVAGVVGVTKDGRTLPLEMLLLPLRRHGRADSRILGALAPSSLPSWVGMQPLWRLDVSSVRVISASGRQAAGFGASDRGTRRPFVVHTGGRIA